MASQRSRQALQSSLALTLTRLLPSRGRPVHPTGQRSKSASKHQEGGFDSGGTRLEILAITAASACADAPRGSHRRLCSTRDGIGSRGLNSHTPRQFLRPSIDRINTPAYHFREYSCSCVGELYTVEITVGAVTWWARPTAITAQMLTQ